MAVSSYNYYRAQTHRSRQYLSHATWTGPSYQVFFDRLAEQCIASDQVEIELTDRRLRTGPKRALTIHEIRTVGATLAIEGQPEYPHIKGRDEVQGYPLCKPMMTAV